MYATLDANMLSVRMRLSCKIERLYNEIGSIKGLYNKKARLD